MRKASLATTALTALAMSITLSAAPAFADGNEGSEGSEGSDGGSSSSSNTNINVPIAKGGDGGDATNYNKINNNDFNANVNANKNEIKHSGNSYNDIDNKDFNANINLNKDYNKNTNKNYNTDINHNSNKQGQGQLQGQQQGQQQGQSQAVQNVGNVHIENERPPVNTAYSAALATSEDTCMGSSSIGGQAVSFGLTIGTTWTDDNCQRLKNSRQLVALGYHRAATSLICFDESVAEAMNRAGTPCPNGAAVYVAPPPVYVPPPQYRMAPIYDAPPPVKRKRKKVLPPK